MDYLFPTSHCSDDSKQVCVRKKVTLGMRRVGIEQRAWRRRHLAKGTALLLSFLLLSFSMSSFVFFDPHNIAQCLQETPLFKIALADTRSFSFPLNSGTIEHADFQPQIHNGPTTMQLTNNTWRDWNPQTHNGQVTWYGYDGNDYEIFLYDGTTTIQLTDNDWYDIEPQIHNRQVTWHDYDKIYLYDGITTMQLTNSTGENWDPHIHNGQVTWYGSDGHDDEIYLYNGTTTMQLTDNDWDDYYPQIHNGQVTWYGSDGHDREIFFYDGFNIRQLTENNYDDINPQIHNRQITWEGYDGNDYEIYLMSVNRLPTVGFNSPRPGDLVSGQQLISWTASDLDRDPLKFDIFYSSDSGTDWHLIEGNLTGTSYWWDTTSLVEGNTYQLRIRALDGYEVTENYTDGTFIVDNTLLLRIMMITTVAGVTALVSVMALAYFYYHYSYSNFLKRRRLPPVAL